MGAEYTVAARSIAIAGMLSDRFASLFSFQLDGPAGVRARDLFAPGWSTVVLTAEGTPPCVGIVPAPREQFQTLMIGGPVTRAVDIEMARSHVVTFSISPVGWAQYVEGDASAYADKIVDGASDPAFGRFAGLTDVVRKKGTGVAEIAAAVEIFLLEMEPMTVPHLDRVRAMQSAFLEEDTGDVDILSRKTGLGRRTLERLARRYFGFSPKTLIRRHRFMRSLAQFMASDKASWSAALDGRYVDQPHFVRDFRAFMGMTPGEFAGMEHPILASVAVQRLADHIDDVAARAPRSGD